MSTRVYGCSDDLIEIEGDVRGETNYHTPDNEDEKHGCLVIVSDGTMLDVRYGKNGEGIWEVKLVKRGDLFERIDQCDDADADPYSDVAHFKDGVKWAYAAKSWEKMT